MTATVALRIDFAMFFWDMAMLSSSKKQYGGNYKLLKDTWEDWPEYNELQPDRVISNEETEPSETASASGEVARSPSRTVDSAEKSWCFTVRNSQLPTTAERPLEAEDATVAVVGLSGGVCDQEHDGSREKNVLISHDGRGRPNYGTLQIL
ncbi:uncharacterized protein [Ptychodera flava]|uniref:uncharacterized protein n=1 Tax=Ptychodera flava TaxID=63121 RepID=UPI00396A843A